MPSIRLFDDPSTAAALLALVVGVGIVSGCGAPGQMYMAPSSMVRVDSLQVTDERIEEAFSTRPQLTTPLNVAVYSAGTFQTGLSDSLRGLERVNRVYEIAPVLVEEDRAYRPYRSGWRGYSPPPDAPLKKLRYLAAQGHADLLVFFSASHRYDDRANWLASTYTLLLPALFVPGRHATLTTDVDVFFVDVRNGFLYASYHDQTEVEKRYVQLGYEHDHGDEVAAENVEALMPGVVEAAQTAIGTDRFYADSTSAE